MNQTAYNYWNNTFTTLQTILSEGTYSYPTGTEYTTFTQKAASELEKVVPKFSQALDENSSYYLRLNSQDTEVWRSVISSVTEKSPDGFMNAQASTYQIRQLQTILNNNKPSSNVGMEAPKQTKHHKKKAA